MATLMAGHFFHTVYTVNLATSMEQETERREGKGYSLGDELSLKAAL